MKIAVVCDEGFKDPIKFTSTMDVYFGLCWANEPDSEIVFSKDSYISGIAQQYSLLRYLNFKEFPNDPKKFGKLANIKRNEDMVKYSDVLVTFMSNMDSEVMSAANLANKYRKSTFIIYY